jgi:predicted RNA binding protein YcfA (HicA-like mRNA interferase family)
MGQRKYPPLKHREVCAILKALGFAPIRQVGSHCQWERPADATKGRKLVPIDDYEEFEQRLLKIMIEQSGFTRVEFYGATRETAKKIR